MSKLKSVATKGFFWGGLERILTQSVTFVLGIIVARILSPVDYGLVAMLYVFISIFGTLIDCGFSTALIRKIDRTESDVSTVFYFNVLIGALAFITFFLLAPLIADFYQNPKLIAMTRVLSIVVLIGSLGAVQQTLLTAWMDFKTQAMISVTTASVAGCLGLGCAYSGMGAWALVVQMICNYTLKTILLWIFVKWRPTMPFSKESFSHLFSFGSKLMVSSLLNALYSNVYTMVIGRVFSATSLGYYSRASQIALYPSQNVTDVIQRVSFPLLSSIQNEDERLADNYRKLLRMSAFIIFPLMIGLAVVAKPLVLLILTDKWSESAVFLQIICFSLMWYPIHALNLNLLQVKGRSDLFLRLEVVKKIVGVAMLCITIPLGLTTMCYGMVVISVIALIINTYYTDKLIQVGFICQMKDLLPTLCLAVTIGATAFFVIGFVESVFLKVVVGILVGSTLYITLSFLFGFREVMEIKNICLMYVSKRKNKPIG